MNTIAEELQNIRYLDIPGFISFPNYFRSRLERLIFMTSLWYVKYRTASWWCVIVGGTGTGKSTLFNCLNGSLISTTGVERPKTRGIILAVPSNMLDAFTHIFGLIGFSVSITSSIPITGSPNCIHITSHNSTEFSDWIFVDTPDLDSFERNHHEAAECMSYLADVVLFVVSQEKYSDLQLVSYLDKFLSINKPLHLVVNKVTSPETVVDDVVTRVNKRVQEKKVAPDDVLAIPLESTILFNYASAWFCNLLKEFMNKKYSEAQKTKISEDSNQVLCSYILDLCKEVKDIIYRENREIDNLTQYCREYAKDAYQALLDYHTQDMVDHVKQFLQNEIKKVYTRYDVLARPRQIVRNIITAPFRFLGLMRSPEKRSEDIVRSLHERIDHSAIIGALDAFVRQWYELLSSYEGKPGIERIRNPNLIVPRNEIRTHLAQRSEELFLWLKEQFSKLSQGIPKTKEWGIYSTVIAWAVFMLSLEAALGGGISLFDAALDSVLAPFISKGAVEWFARKDIQRIGKELIERYRDALREVIEMQQDRFISELEEMRISEDRIKPLLKLCDIQLKQICTAR